MKLDPYEAPEMMCMAGSSGFPASDTMVASDLESVRILASSDLSAAYGVMLKPNEPVVQDAIQKILEGAKKHGKACGILAPAEADARKYLEMGMTYVAVGGDSGLLRGAAVALAQKFKPKA